jgi:pyruvate, orthophosphate dikinase
MAGDEPPVVVGADEHVDHDRSLVGRKGASLFNMTALGLPVPPFFVVTTRAWRDWQRAGRLPAKHVERVLEMIGWLERRTGRTFGRGPRPLLISVCSTGPVSMPGMLDSILNLGLGPEAVAALYPEFRSLRTVADMINTFVETATPVFAGSARNGSKPDIPESAQDQLLGAIEGVFASWNNEQARLYRRISRIPDDYGTAVVVQAMVFGNADADSGTGVLFTRDPVTGGDEPRGEWVRQAQGEAIVSAQSTPEPLEHLARSQPQAHAKLLRFARRLEHDATESQDIEFTVQAGQLYLLQTRAMKCHPLAGCRLTLALLDEGTIDRSEAVRRLSCLELADLAIEVLADGPADEVVLASGLGASPGIVHGVVASELLPAPAASADRSPLILRRPETSPRDVSAMRGAAGLVTERGGLTSHAAVTARELRIPCVVGCGPLDTIRDGLEITLDGGAGRLLRGRHKIERYVPEIAHRALSVLAEHGDVSVP